MDRTERHAGHGTDTDQGRKKDPQQIGSKTCSTRTAARVLHM
ncbi:MAG: hypothetical protein U1E64_13200 [Sphingomonadaceae bacterium]